MRHSAVWLAMLVVLLAGVVMSACGPDAAQAQARQNKAKLDSELTHARADLGLPDTLLRPIINDEHKVASGEGGFFYNYGDAATEYSQLYAQLTGIEQTAQATLRQQAQADLQAFAIILNQRRGEGFAEIPAYQTRLDQAQKDFDAAQRPGDYAAVSAVAQAQTQALQAMWPAYQKLLTLKSVIDSLNSAGVPSHLGQTLYDQDVQAFRNAESATRYGTLTTGIDGQIMQLLADQTTAQPTVTASLLQGFQARIDLLRQYGDTASANTYQQQHDDDDQQLRAARQVADYLTLGQTITKQTNTMAIPLIRAKATFDLGILQQLVNSVATRTVTNPADGKQYPLAYEYTSSALGIGDASDNLKAARTQAQFQSTDFEITSLTAGLRAMLDNLRDTTAHNQVHQTDLQLMRFYNVSSGRVVMVSLREQTARFYENGALVNWSYVTTGRPELPSWPGFHVAQSRLSPTLFTSPDPAGSPDYYQPTPIHYAVEYNAGGFFLHDAWWRKEFGPNTNLPHHDPAAFNGGSHGCVNFPLANMGWVYNFTLHGTPIILY